MATIHFYEKPGCVNNARQKQLLIQAGHVLVVHDLLKQPWAGQRGKLRAFFGDMPVADWFNRSAPAVKNGEVTPESLSKQQAIDLMVADPLLIRRPLLEMGDRRLAGFDTDQLQAWLGLSIEAKTAPDLETCPKQHSPKACSP
jgi:nitrogenase-associated protein